MAETYKIPSFQKISQHHQEVFAEKFNFSKLNSDIKINTGPTTWTTNFNSQLIEHPNLVDAQTVKFDQVRFKLQVLSNASVEFSDNFSQTKLKKHFGAAENSAQVFCSAKIISEHKKFQDPIFCLKGYDHKKLKAHFKGNFVLIFFWPDLKFCS